MKQRQFKKLIKKGVIPERFRDLSQAGMASASVTRILVDNFRRLAAILASGRHSDHQRSTH